MKTLNCPECKQPVWDGPKGNKLAKCWNSSGHKSGGTLAFDAEEEWALYPDDLFEDTHISDIKVGDTVFHDGHLRTVCPKDLKGPDSVGRRLFGDSYMLGRQLVKRWVSPEEARRRNQGANDGTQNQG